MDGLKRIAVHSYQQLWNEDQKKQAENFFNLLDWNDDKTVSFEELRDKNIISKGLFSLFIRFDTNNNGVLDFEEVLCLYYYKYVMAEVVMSYNPSARFCKGLSCVRLENSPDFSCFLCLSKKFRRSYHLCSSCHDKGMHTHMHTKHPECMLINREALDVIDKMKKLLFDQNDQAQMYPDYMEMGSDILSNVAGSVISGMLVGGAGACTIM